MNCLQHLVTRRLLRVDSGSMQITHKSFDPTSSSFPRQLKLNQELTRFFDAHCMIHIQIVSILASHNYDEIISHNNLLYTHGVLRDLQGKVGLSKHNGVLVPLYSVTFKRHRTECCSEVVFYTYTPLTVWSVMKSVLIYIYARSPDDPKYTCLP